MSMGDDFAGLVERHRNIDIAEIGRRVLDDSRYEVIWRGGGYLMVGTAPERRPSAVRRPEPRLDLDLAVPALFE